MAVAVRGRHDVVVRRKSPDDVLVFSVLCVHFTRGADCNVGNEILANVWISSSNIFWRRPPLFSRRKPSTQAVPRRRKAAMSVMDDVKNVLKWVTEKKYMEKPVRIGEHSMFSPKRCKERLEAESDY